MDKKELVPATAGGWSLMRGTLVDCHHAIFAAEERKQNGLARRFGLDDTNEDRWVQWRETIEALIVANPSVTKAALIDRFFAIFAVQEKVPPLPKLYSETAYATPDEATVGVIDGRPNMMSIQFNVSGQLYELIYVLGRLNLRRVDSVAKRRQTVVSM